MKRIAIDAMGGDHGPRVIVPAVEQALKAYSQLHVILVGLQPALDAAVKKVSKDLLPRIELVYASEVIEMGESPSKALRNKKDSSMRVAINMVKEGRAQACVSSGNTGALMVTARFVLKTLPGIDRPAILSRFPTKKNQPVRVLDLGANVDSSAEQLFQFAVMGSIVASAVSGIERPTIGLLNVGEEEIKGNEQVKKTAELLSSTDLINYYGFVEGDALFSGLVDVIVCDGFVGNVALKAVEGAVRFVGRHMQQAYRKNWLTRLCFLPLLSMKKLIDPRQYNGATFVGLDGIVIKSHGSADKVAFVKAIEEALAEVDKNIPELIKKNMTQLTSKDA
jgi:phosphate acyltransferase